MYLTLRTIRTAGLYVLLAAAAMQVAYSATPASQTPSPSDAFAPAPNRGSTLSQQTVPVVRNGPTPGQRPTAAPAARVPARGRPQADLMTNTELARDFEFVPNESAGGRVVRGGGNMEVSMTVTYPDPTPAEQVDIHVVPGREVKLPKPRIWAAPGNVDISPITGNLFHDGHLVYEEGHERVAHRLSNEVWDSAAGLVRLTAGRLSRGKGGVGFHLVTELEGKRRRIAIEADDLDGPRVLPAKRCIQIYRVWYVRSPKGRDPDGWHPDAKIPLSAPLRLPALDNNLPDQTNQAFYVGIYIPPVARPGLYKTVLHVRDLDDPTYAADIPVHVTVTSVPVPGQP